MSERMDRARAEAARDAFYQARWEQKKSLDSLRFGVEWADANPQPRTITADQCNDIEDAVHEGVPLGHMLRRLGIEVVDTDQVDIADDNVD